MPRILFAFLLFIATSLNAGSVEPRDGWEVRDTDKTFSALVSSVRAAAKANGMIVVTQAGPTKAAASRGITIPGNRIMGVYNNDFAVRMLEQSVPAMIEAPVRFYVTEDEDGTATLSWKTPSLVFAPYVAEAPGVAAIALELDAKFVAIGNAAAQ